MIPTLEKFRQWLLYDPLKGVFIRMAGRNASNIAYLEKTPKGPRVHVFGRYYYARALAWFMTHGEWPLPGKLKSIDGDKYNLRLANLKLAPEGSYKCEVCLGGTGQGCVQCGKNIRSPHRNRGGKRKSYYEKARLKLYGLTEEEHEMLLVSQRGLCAICKKEENGKALAIDHCHKTNKVRALLCAKCNTGLGSFDDDPRLLVEAAKYLLSHK